MFHFKKNNMYYQSCAAKGNYRGREWQLHHRSMERAAVNIYKTDNSYEMLVFAPGRLKEHFRVDVKGRELTVSYVPPEGFPKPEWIRREYSRGGFTRSFTLDDTVDTNTITARYTDGVLHISLPVVQGSEGTAQQVPVG